MFTQQPLLFFRALPLLLLLWNLSSFDLPFKRYWTLDRHTSVRAAPEKCDKLETDDRHKAQRNEGNSRFSGHYTRKKMFEPDNGYRLS